MVSKISKILILTVIILSNGTVLGADKKQIEKGKEVFNLNCVTCHGEKGDGNGPAGMALNPKPRNFSTDEFKAGSSADAIFNTVTNGLPGTLMVSYKHLPEADRKAVVQYIIATFHPKKSTAAKPATKK